jgi:hypothetical protein
MVISLCVRKNFVIVRCKKFFILHVMDEIVLITYDEELASAAAPAQASTAAAARERKNLEPAGLASASEASCQPVTSIAVCVPVLLETLACSSAPSENPTSIARPIRPASSPAKPLPSLPKTNLASSSNPHRPTASQPTSSVQKASQPTSSFQKGHILNDGANLDPSRDPFSQLNKSPRLRRADSEESEFKPISRSRLSSNRSFAFSGSKTDSSSGHRRFSPFRSNSHKRRSPSPVNRHHRLRSRSPPHRPLLNRRSTSRSRSPRRNSSPSPARTLRRQSPPHPNPCYVAPAGQVTPIYDEASFTQSLSREQLFFLSTNFFFFSVGRRPRHFPKVSL